MAFWGCVLKPGQKKPVNVGGSDVLHLSQVCLHDPKPGKNFLQVEVQGTTYSIACLEKDKREHDCVDLFFDSNETSFVAKGTSEIHLMGYIEPSDMQGEQEDSEEEEQEQQVVPKAPKSASPKLSPKVVAAGSPKKSPLAAAKAAADEDSDDFDEDDEGEEEEEGLSASECDMEEFDDEDEESEEESLPAGKSAGLSKSPKQAPAQSPKRKAEDAPEASKKAKTDGGSADETAEYVKKVVAYLKANGKQNTGQLGSKVPRPSGVPKLKALFDQNKDKFNIVGDVVSLK
jgi:hypothetical protein